MYIKNINGLNLSPTTLMEIVYGKESFYLRNRYPLSGQIVLASKIGHAGDGTLPGKAVVLAEIQKIEKIKNGLYRYKIQNADVFEPIDTNTTETAFELNDIELNMLDDPNNIEWLEKYFNPYVKGAYIDYTGEWVVPDPEYL